MTLTLTLMPLAPEHLGDVPSSIDMEPIRAAWEQAIIDDLARYGIAVEVCYRDYISPDRFEDVNAAVLDALGTYGAETLEHILGESSAQPAVLAAIDAAEQTAQVREES